jgi:osmotically-inducible protein OsmY
MDMNRREIEDYVWFGGSMSSRTSDGEIRAFLLDQLREDPFTRHQSIHVLVDSGIVTLSGDVSSSVARRAADDDAWATPGVRDVNNHLRVVPVRVASPDGPRAA